MNDQINTAEVFNFAEKVAYSSNGIVSKRIIQKQVGNITLFAFDAGQELSEHTAPFDALIQVLEGEAEIIINHVPYTVSVGNSIIMPGGIPHAVKAHKQFKMLLTMIKM
ncbi:MAG TPA: cupin domain-containing protein [Bacteroidales bacterium]|nr:cupin domain-containing protein [Bacteroidales bacterium]